MVRDLSCGGVGQGRTKIFLICGPGLACGEDSPPPWIKQSGVMLGVFSPLNTASFLAAFRGNPNFSWTLQPWDLGNIGPISLSKPNIWVNSDLIL